MISSFRREVDEICALLGPYAGSSGNFVTTFRATFRSYHQGSSGTEDGTDSLSRKSVGNYH